MDISLYPQRQQLKNLITPAKSNMTDPEASSATLNWTTNTTHTVNENRVGKFLHLEGNITLAGAPDSATLTITLPETIDTTVFDTNTDNSLGGTFDYIDGGVRVTHAGKIRFATSTTMIFTINDTDLTQASPITWASTDEINYKIKVPIVGFDSNALFLTGLPSGLVRTIGTATGEPFLYSALVSATGVVSSEVGNWINGNCTNASPIVCTLESDAFSSVMNCWANALGSGSIECHINTVTGTSTMDVVCTRNNDDDETNTISKMVFCHGE